MCGVDDWSIITLCHTHSNSFTWSSWLIHVWSSWPTHQHTWCFLRAEATSLPSSALSLAPFLHRSKHAAFIRTADFSFVTFVFIFLEIYKNIPFKHAQAPTLSHAVLFNKDLHSWQEPYNTYKVITKSAFSASTFTYPFTAGLGIYLKVWLSMFPKYHFVLFWSVLLKEIPKPAFSAPTFSAGSGICLGIKFPIAFLGCPSCLFVKTDTSTILSSHTLPHIILFLSSSVSLSVSLSLSRSFFRVHLLAVSLSLFLLTRTQT